MGDGVGVDAKWFHTAGQPKIPTPHDVPADISCEPAASTINRWLEECEKHPECNSHNFFGGQVPQAKISRKVAVSAGESETERDKFAPILPKRMILLGEKAKTARLVDIHSNTRVPYAALSYCWGEKATFMTEKHTLSGFKQNIPMDKLPQTIKDAFCLTKELGLDYLWIDAICIVQKEKEEWEEESQKMGHIYSNAKIVLAATRSSNVHDGMYTQRSVTPLSKDIEAPGGSMRARRNLNHGVIVSCRTKSDCWWGRCIKAAFYRWLLHSFATYRFLPMTSQRYDHSFGFSPSFAPSCIFNSVTV
jgi:hypothetical protein